jgi:hypothetical protein
LVILIFGYPLRPFLRWLLLPKLLAGKSPNGFRTAKIFVPADNLDDGHEVDKFKKCVALFLESAKPNQPNPCTRTPGLEACQMMIFTIFMLYTPPTI